MRAVVVTMVVIALWIEAPRTSADATDYGKMSKAQMVHRLGLPLAVVISCFDFMKQFPEFAALAPASGGSASFR
jgi:hypothetical protein